MVSIKQTGLCMETKKCEVCSIGLHLLFAFSSGLNSCLELWLGSVTFHTICGGLGLLKCAVSSPLFGQAVSASVHCSGHFCEAACV